MGPSINNILWIEVLKVFECFLKKTLFMDGPGQKKPMENMQMKRNRKKHRSMQEFINAKLTCEFHHSDDFEPEFLSFYLFSLNTTQLCMN